MNKQKVLRRLREKLAKVSVYHTEAKKVWGKEIASEMFHEDLDFLSTLLYFMDQVQDDAIEQ